MRGKQAKTLSDDNLEDLVLVAETSRHPLRNKVIVLLSAKAGLRAGEIARLTWAMVTDPTGDPGHSVASRCDLLEVFVQAIAWTSG
jgi:integrase